MRGLTGQYQRFAEGGFHGEVDRDFGTTEGLSEIRRVIDPSSALTTVHWGRNYIYLAELAAPSGVVPVVVKQFRNSGTRRRLERRWRGSKAERSWAVARALTAAGIATPGPVALVESDVADGPSFFITLRIDDAHEVRHFFRRLNDEPDAGGFPDVDELDFLDQLGRHARRLHDAGIVYRDLSMGNILATGTGPAPELWLVDLNRARVGVRPGVWRRTRDICRLPVLEPEHRQAFLRGYWGRAPSRWSVRWWLYGLSVDAYILKHAIKNRLRGVGLRSEHRRKDTAYDHIPAAPAGAGRRDLAVWDHLSDQPHQHAGRWAKRWIRLIDSPHHLRELVVVAMSAPKIAARYRQLTRELHTRPVPMDGFGLCVRPWPDDPEAHLAAVTDLGVGTVLLRLHPWQDDHDAEEELACELHRRGIELVFALPQVRALVTDAARWRAAVEELGGRFSPYGRYFQIGQAVNRSKWGIWARSEYVRMYRSAAEVLRRVDGVRLLGPAVIDFELQVTAALANARGRGLDVDVLSSLLYVDRRGAPENAQLGFDTVDKALLLKAIADTGRNTAGRAWITEVNWPLWEGPHSPAGKTVSVDEQTQADYLVRYYLLTLASGAVERVYWWRLLARGYGLAVAQPDGGLRRRPAWHAFRTLIVELSGSIFTG
ncbi:MAG: lipopolysaccharide kinase InaA family protein, partial [Holophagae bacterium]